jgi:hypothetical protein
MLFKGEEGVGSAREKNNSFFLTPDFPKFMDWPLLPVPQAFTEFGWIQQFNYVPRLSRVGKS